MHISLHGDADDMLAESRISRNYLQINTIGETLEELRDVEFLRPDGSADYAVKYINKGVMECDFGNGWEGISAGTVLLFKPGEMQSSRLRRTEDFDQLFVHFSGTAVPDIWRSLGFEGRQRLSVEGAEDVVTVWREIIVELIRNRPGSEQMVNAKLLEMLTLISRCAGCPAQSAIEDEQTVVGNMWDESLAPALQEIHVCYDEDLSLERLADACHLSMYYFSRRFRHVMEMSPHQYVTKVRMQQACRLLVNTDAPVDEIAVAVGFPAEASFRAAFRRTVGCSPTGYRKAKTARK